MGNVSKIITKKQKLRCMIFDRRCVSRQELTELCNLNYRSVISYTDELKSQGLIREESQSGDRGRPGIYYLSNSDKVIFIGITLVVNDLCFVVLDINSFVLYSRVLPVPQEINPAEFGQLACSEIDGILARLKEKALCGIGFNLCHYEQKVKQASMFRELAGTVRRRYSTHVELYDNDSYMLKGFCWQQMLSGTSGAFIPGDEIRLAIVKDGAIMDDFSQYLKNLRHWQLDRQSPFKCSCGKNGCVQALLTYEGIIARYCLAARLDQGKMSVLSYWAELTALEDTGDPLAHKLMAENARLMAIVLHKIRRELKLDRIFFFHSSKFLFERTAEEYQRIGGPDCVPLGFARFSVADALIAPGLFMIEKLMNFQLFENGCGTQEGGK